MFYINKVLLILPFWHFYIKSELQNEIASLFSKIKSVKTYELTSNRFKAAQYPDTLFIKKVIFSSNRWEVIEIKIDPDSEAVFDSNKEFFIIISAIFFKLMHPLTYFAELFLKIV